GMCAVVLQYVEQMDPLMLDLPERALHEHQVAVALERDAEPASPLVRERAARGGGRVVADARAARAAVPLVRLVEVPELERPVHSDSVADERPVVVLDLRVQLGGESRCRDRARVPADRRLRLELLERRGLRLRERLAARLERRALGGAETCLHALDEQWQARLPVA